MYLKELQKNWNTFGEEDAMWAVCSSPEKKHNKWDSQDFFSSGVRTIDKLIAWTDANGLPQSKSTALDFGCGVGRLTQALCSHFDQCIGVDIAPSMIRQAKKFNQHGKRCTYRLNETENLSIFPSATFDLINTEHVLQHIRPRTALHYIAEFVRLLKPGGLAYFHCPSRIATRAYPPEGIRCALKTTTNNLTIEHMSFATVPLRVTNTGNHPIGMSKTINAPAKIVHHWFQEETNTLIPDHGFTNVPSAVFAPGEFVDFEYRAASPAEPGKYALILTPADYFHRPAHQKNSDMIKVSVEVTPQTKQDLNEDTISTTERPRSESHAISIEKVTKVVKLAGGRIVETKSSQAHPGAVVRTDYYITR